jgi:hypothetical protein
MVRTTFGRWVLLGVALALASPFAYGVIMAPLPLRDVVQQSHYICVTRVEQFFPDKPAMLLAVEEDLRGKMSLRKLPVLIKADEDGQKLNHVPQLLKRLAPKLPIVMFIEDRKDRFVALAYTNGTWMQMVAQKGDADAAVWILTHGEPYLRRTFKGPTAEMRQVLIDAIAGKKRLPAINEKETPGFGPEVETK